MDIFASFAERVAAAVATLVAAGKLPEGLPLERITVEPPRDAAHGDLSTNAAMVLAKPAGTNPRALAETLAADLGTDPRVASVSVAGPGFINLTLAPQVYS